MISSLFFVFAFLYSLSVYLAVSFSVVISSLFFVFAFLYSLSVYLAVSFSVVISPSVSPFVVLSKNLSTAGLLSQSQLHQSPVSQHCLFPPPTTKTRGWALRSSCLHRRIKWPPRRSACPAAFSGTEIGATLTEIQTHRALFLSTLQNFVTCHQEACF